MLESNHLFFDLDHTLWDFEANAEETLKELYLKHELANYTDHDSAFFIATYQRINNQLWDLYNHGAIDKQTLRTQRFHDTFKTMGYPEKSIPGNLWEEYIDICPTKTKLIDGALDLLEYLYVNYNLHLITNGFSETQKRKIKHAGIEEYFQTLTISEEIGFQKPHHKIFEHALANVSRELSAVYVGDNFQADVIGGVGSGWKVFWFNPFEKVVDHELLRISDKHENYFTPDSFPYELMVDIKKLDELKKHF